MSQLLQEAVGRRMALQLSLTGAWLDAGRALSLGLVNEVVPPERLLPRAREVAGMIAANDPGRVAMLRRLIRSRADATLTKALEAERAGFRRFLDRHGKLGR
jgi:enoyl-CoA hydratase/carnithine racemase